MATKSEVEAAIATITDGGRNKALKFRGVLNTMLGYSASPKQININGSSYQDDDWIGRNFVALIGQGFPDVPYTFNSVTGTITFEESLTINGVIAI